MTWAGRVVLGVVGVGLLAAVPRAAPPSTEEVPRVVLALYEGARFDDPALTPTHRLLELPLNHLGLVLRYHDVRHPLPDPASLRGVRGVLTWFQSDGVLPDPVRYARWARTLLASGRRFVVIGSAGLSRDAAGRPVASAVAREFFTALGIELEGTWVSTTYDVAVAWRDRDLLDFERTLPTVLPGFLRMRAVPGRATAHLVLRRRGDVASESHAVITSPHGGFVAAGFTHYAAEAGGLERRQWYLNPFEFFRLAFNTDDLPKPDTTTLSGRRLFYSHIDGDGWRSLTEIEPHRRRRLTAARVVLDEIIDRYPDFPVTVGPIVADLDPQWHGTTEHRAVAREIFARPHVEAASHTYSHPLDWRFFERYDAEAERRYGRSQKRLRAHTDAAVAPDYDRPRSYVDVPFDLEREIAGSVTAVQALLPPGKRVELVQWSGDTLPFPAAVAAVRRLGLRAINGGDTRFDRDFPSYAWVAPIGRPVGRDWQIYSSNSNENTYTDLWTDRFFGFTFLVRTIRNTELPLRVKPFNVYYHMYSGEKLAALNAVRRNLDYARTQELAPVTASRYTAVAEGFYTTRIERLGPRRWRVHDRGALNTIRFDRASRLAVDFARSAGVIGTRHLHGSLYVALDEHAPVAEIALREMTPAEEIPSSDRAYLVQARWRVWHVRHEAGGWRFRTQGFGPGEFTWQLPGQGRVRVFVGHASTPAAEARSDGDGLVSFTLPLPGLTPVDVRVAVVEGTT